MRWEIYDAAHRPRVLIMVSKLDHCLNDLLYRLSLMGLVDLQLPQPVEQRVAQGFGNRRDDLHPVKCLVE